MSLITLHQGGTLTESSSSPAFATAQRGVGHGTRTRRSRHTVRQRLIALIHFDTVGNLPGTPGFDPTQPIAPPFFAGWQTLTQTITFTGTDYFKSAGGNEFFKADGERYRTGCSTAEATRF